MPEEKQEKWLMKRPGLWIVGLVVGAVGLVHFADGFFMFFN